MSATNDNASVSPGRLLRMTLQVYANTKNKPEDNEAFARQYHARVASIHARNGIEAYQQVFTPPPYRAALDEMNRARNRGWVVDDHDLTAEFYFPSFADLERVRADPDFQALQVAEGPYVNLVHTVVSLGWVERYVDAGKVVNIGEDGKSMYPPWKELMDLSTAGGPPVGK